MIESLHLKNIATYDSSGVIITGLKKINFIYGVNGSGKTTMTKYIAAPDMPAFSHCALNWKNTLTVKPLVYNKDFRDNNFGRGKMDGVFTLGQATKEQISVIESKTAEKQALKNNWVKSKETLDKQVQQKTQKQGEFQEAAWSEVYKKHENEFKEAFSGFMTKVNFKNKLLEEYKNNKTVLAAYKDLQERAKTIFGKVPLAITAIAVIDFKRLLEIEQDKIWRKKVVGKADVDIAKMIQRLNINDWVSEGSKYIQNDPTCPFCQQPTITADFKKQLESYFDESFISDTQLIKTLTEEYNRLALNLVNLLQQIEQSEKTNTNSKLDLETFLAYLKTFSTQVITNQELLNNKGKEPSRDIQLVSIKEQLEQMSLLIDKANKEIIKHNGIVSNFAKEKQNLIIAVWRYLTEDHKVIIQNFINEQANYNKAIQGIEQAIKTTVGKHNALSQEIKDLSKTVTSVQPSIDNINDTLKSYGFHNFSIVPFPGEQNKYQIQREDGTIAEATMSEGEITFLTFLYFLQLTKGSVLETNVGEDRILVIDDPISSLDSNVLFVVSSLVKEIIKAIKSDKGNIKQLILLTHNVYFHKEVSFIDGRTKFCKDTAYWMLRRNKKISAVQAFESNNPIQNSYELLWAELRNREHNSGLTIQNTMRRIIENYFKILGKYGDDDLIHQFPNHEEQEICRSLLCWINDGSHSIPDDLFIEQDGVMDRYFQVFEKIFDHTKHKEHFNMMMGISAA